MEEPYHPPPPLLRHRVGVVGVLGLVHEPSSPRCRSVGGGSGPHPQAVARALGEVALGPREAAGVDERVQKGNQSGRTKKSEFENYCFGLRRSQDHGTVEVVVIWTILNLYLYSREKEKKI